MKKIIALGLALIMALSLGSVAFAAHEAGTIDDVDVVCTLADGHLCPGETYTLDKIAAVPSYKSTKEGVAAPTDFATEVLVNKDWKAVATWTKGGALVKAVQWNKDDKIWELVLN